MTILDIYQRYQIMPQLQEHQLRVAAVAEVICEHINAEVNKHDVVAACLLHDMGNIVKFNFSQEHLDRLPGLVDSESVPAWEQVKRAFIERYGSDSHAATIKILKELKVSERIVVLADSVGFEEGIAVASVNDIERKICSYADGRVMPLQVASLEERLADLRIRYQGHPEGRYKREDYEQALRQTERQIFAHCDIKPEDIAEQTTEDRKERLKEFQI